MAVVPEKIIQELLIEKLGDIKEDDRALDYIFSNLKSNDLQAIKDAFRDTTISVVIGFSRKEVSLPMVSILLGTETESQPYLGNLLGSHDKPYDVGGDNPPVTDNVGSFTSKDFWYGNARLDQGKIAYGSTAAPRKLFKVDEDIVTRRGSTYSCNFLLHILTMDGFYTSVLYRIIQQIIESNLMVLEANGIIQIYLSGTDMSPLEVALPDPCFERTLAIACLNTVDYFESTRDRIKLGIYQTECHLDMDPLHPCPDISGTVFSTEPPKGYTCETRTLKGYPLKITGVTPPAIPVNTETNLLIEGLNMDKDARIEFVDLPYQELPSGAKRGIQELRRDYVMDNALRLKVKGYTLGTTDLKFTNPTGEFVVVEGAVNVI